MTELDVPSGAPARIATPRPGDPRLARLSLNQWTTQRWSVGAAVDGCVRAGIPAIGLWREQVGEFGVTAAARRVAEAGLRVSSLCRGRQLSSGEVDDNRRALDEAAELGAPCLVLVVGGLPDGSRSLADARRRVADTLAALVPHAAAVGVRLALEPLHPMYAADRSVVNTLGQALDLAEEHPVEHVGVVVDTFHVWWDPDLEAQLARAGNRIASYQLADWITPLPADALLGRGMIGDGHVDFRHLGTAVTAAGYTGDIEVEIFNADVWAADGDAVLATVTRRFVELV